MAEGSDNMLKAGEPISREAAAKARFEKFSPADEDDYADFLMSAYQDQFNRERFMDREAVKRLWRWEYNDKPVFLPEKPLIWVCRLEDRIVGQLCIMPAEVKMGDTIYKGGWMQDLVFLPEMRNTGIGFFLIRHVMEQLSGILDVVMIAGTNNQSYLLFKAMGFFDLGGINCNVFPVAPKNLSEKAVDNKMARSFLNVLANIYFRTTRLYRFAAKSKEIEIREEDRFGAQFDDFWFDMSKKFACMTKRDQQTLEWRFHCHPHWRYKAFDAYVNGVLKGYIVLRQSAIKNGRFAGLKSGVISDILFDPDNRDIGYSILAAALDYFKGEVDVIRCDVFSYGMQSLLESAGFIKMKSSSRFLIYALSEKLRPMEKQLVKDARSWNLTYADSDLDLF